MDTSAVFARTETGIQAFAAGATAPLSSGQRTVLVLIDGNRSAAEIHRVVGTICNGYSTLTQLVDLRLIEKKPTAQIASAVRMLPQSASARNELRYYATRTVADTLGPMADQICLQIDRAETDDHFVNALEKARMALVHYAGAARANAFSAHVQYLSSERHALPIAA
jgi:hypothetical protein